MNIQNRNRLTDAENGRMVARGVGTLGWQVKKVKE